MAFQRIAIDGSPASQEACRVGLDVALAHGAEVTFLHASRAISDSLFEDDPLGPASLEDVLAADGVLREAFELATGKGVVAEVNVIGDEDVEALIPAIVG